MGGYKDFHMVVSPTGNSVAGVCHARGKNADIPTGWLIYILQLRMWKKVLNYARSLVEKCWSNQEAWERDDFVLLEIHLKLSILYIAHQNDKCYFTK